MTKYELDEKAIAKEFSSGQIKGYMRSLKCSRLESLLYLWAFNHFHTCAQEVQINCGRPMYAKLARCLSKLFKEQTTRMTWKELIKQCPFKNVQRVNPDVWIKDREILCRVNSFITAIFREETGDVVIRDDFKKQEVIIKNRTKKQMAMIMQGLK